MFVHYASQAKSKISFTNYYNTMYDLASTYRAWLDCTSQGKWDELLTYMHSIYNYNGKNFTAEDFAEFVKKEANRFSSYTITMDTILVNDDAQCIACRLYGKGKPADKMFGYDPTGQDVYFMEHHLVWFTGGKISKTLYVLDILSIRHQFKNPGETYVLELVNRAPVSASKTLSKQGLEDASRTFFNSINTRTMASELPKIIHSDLWHNGKKLTLDVYLGLIDKGISAIPDVQFDIQNVVADHDTQRVFVRLEHHCTPTKEIAGLVPNGQAVRFAEHSIYQFEDGKISRMWAIVDWEGPRRQMAAKQSPV
jgi:predicted ester cyclase